MGPQEVTGNSLLPTGSSASGENSADQHVTYQQEADVIVVLARMVAVA
jgi:hypothetical protein